MKIAYFSSVLNHHQIEFCDAMYEAYGDDFVFVSTMDIEEQRMKLGYTLFERPYNLKMHTGAEPYRAAEALFQEADVVILGVFLEEWLQQRLKRNKITFLHKERLFKEKPSLYWRLRCLLFVIREYYPHRHRPFYMLAASAYAYADYTSLGFFGDKTFAWGYFPPVKTYVPDVLMAKKADALRLLWAGRLLPWKHPEYAVAVAQRLRDSGIPFHLDMVGNGPMEDELRQRVQREGLDSCVTLAGAMPPARVREYMEAASVYLFTSNREEGFGAVLTEAMNSGCAVMASATAGATNLLVRDGVNGCVYNNDSVRELCDTVTRIAAERQTMEALGREAYRTVDTLQNARVAAERFSAVAKALVQGKDIPVFEDGPMHKVR